MVLTIVVGAIVAVTIVVGTIVVWAIAGPSPRTSWWGPSWS